DPGRAEVHAEIFDLQQRRHDLRVSKASRNASPMKVSRSKVKTSSRKVGTDIHHASRLSLPWRRRSPKDGSVVTPSPRKSSDARNRIAALMRKGRNVITGVIEFGSRCRQMIWVFDRPIARAALTNSRLRLRRNSART